AAQIGGLLLGGWLGLMVAPCAPATLASLWQRASQTSARFRDRYSRAIALGGVGALILLLVAALQLTPLWA
ncbi:MAG: hypothetical protein ACR2H0_06525, partial [Candidatus Limnocylindrales bacterium]